MPLCQGVWKATMHGGSATRGGVVGGVTATLSSKINLILVSTLYQEKREHKREHYGHYDYTSS